MLPNPIESMQFFFSSEFQPTVFDMCSQAEYLAMNIFLELIQLKWWAEGEHFLFGSLSMNQKLVVAQFMKI